MGNLVSLLNHTLNRIQDPSNTIASEIKIPETCLPTRVYEKLNSAINTFFHESITHGKEREHYVNLLFNAIEEQDNYRLQLLNTGPSIPSKKQKEIDSKLEMILRKQLIEGHKSGTTRIACHIDDLGGKYTIRNINQKDPQEFQKYSVIQEIIIPKEGEEMLKYFQEDSFYVLSKQTNSPFKT